MNRKSSSNDDEIDLIYLIKIILNGKIKIFIITIISFLIGLGYSHKIPNNYLNSLKINKSVNSEFNKLIYVAKMIETNQTIPTNQASQVNKIILDRFMSELKDFKEFILNLRYTKKFKENYSKLSIKDQEKELLKYIKLLDIVEPTNDQDYLIINLKWNNTDEASNILEDTINLTLKNLENSIYKLFEQSLEFEKKINLNIDRERLDYLTEQSSIARELGIIDNQIDNVNLSQSNVSLNINTADIAYYLRGYKAIDKEIELIKNRDYKKFKFIKQELNFLKKEKINWVDYNINLIDTKLLKDTQSIILNSIMAGLIFGVFFVLLSYAIQSHRVLIKTK
jgi:LPS O-antigen subunit length determinant protein (WzzB/FepE family)